MDNETFRACQLAIRDRIKLINQMRTRNAPQSHRSGLVSIGFVIDALARRFIKPPDWPGHDVTDDVRMGWELAWYFDYCKAIAEVCRAAQTAVRKGQLTLRSQTTRVPLDHSRLDPWLAMDVDAEHQLLAKEFFPRVRELQSFIDVWPDMVGMPPGAAYATDVAQWTVSIGIAPASEVMELLKVNGNVASVPTLATTPPSVSNPPIQPTSVDWKALARARAVAIVERQRSLDLYPSQETIGDEISAEFRANGTMGSDGKPLTGSYIKRHAMKGISSASVKRLSTTTRRGN